ncbi:R-spondin-3-like [Acropora millepora]|uniref:R-spondin-3-like n=1 Tax=Acropora millepora TaxID=45264 RepID=UPI001CF2784A|nr:R-spondin-3-like [Acropora millepora]
MLSLAKTTILFLLLLVVAFHNTKAWRRRRRSCSVVHCRVNHWSLWSSCSAIKCEQSRSRSIITTPSCGGNACPSNLLESRHCFAEAENCQLSSWSQWSACTALTCETSSGMQTSSRHKIKEEKCGGRCTTTFRKTRSCIQSSLPCFNGGTYKQNEGCVCKQGYNGECCEKRSESSEENTQSGHHLAIILAGAIGGAILLVIVVIVVYKLNINAENVIQICCCFLSICD